MGLLKHPLIWTVMLLLASCSLFSETPPKVIEGQRGAYKGLLVIEENVSTILKVYEQDCKAAVKYHAEYIWQLKINQASLSKTLTPELQVTLDSERDSEITSAFSKIDQKKESLEKAVNTNFIATKQLIEAIYNYMSTTPIGIDNVDFWILKIDEAQHGRRN